MLQPHCQLCPSPPPRFLMWRGLGSLQVFFQPFKLSLDTVHYEAPSSHRNGAVLGHGGTFCIPHYGGRGPCWVLGVLSSVPSSMPLGSWMLFTHVDSLVLERSCAGNHPALPGPIAVTSLPLGGRLEMALLTIPHPPCHGR